MTKRNSINYFLVLILIVRILLFSNTSNPPDPSNFSSPLAFTSLQQRLDLAFASSLPNKEAGLLSGIVLGTKKSLPTKLYQQMIQTGTIHIAVASGMNITLLITPLFNFLTLFLNRKIALVALTILIWFYALLSGFQPPIVRASLMASLLYLSQEFGRKADSLRILIMTGYVMVMVKPDLIFDLSFQLSFFSMLGLSFIQPTLRKSSNRLLKSENFSATLACQLATLPIIMANFGEYNLFSPFINFLILPVVPYILGIGLLAAFFSLFSRMIAYLLALISYPFLWYLSRLLSFCADVKIFQVWTPKWSWGLALGYHLIVGWWVYKKRKS